MEYKKLKRRKLSKAHNLPFISVDFLKSRVINKLI
jgi:hypothetical protein